MNFLLDQFKTSRLSQFTILVFAVLTIWWGYMYFTGTIEGVGLTWLLLIYPLPTLLGGVYGLNVAKKWGGLRSVLGSCITFFALGLLAQTFGQYLYNYYTLYIGIEVAYPSIGDFFYFASVLLYLIAAYQLAKVMGVKFALKSLSGKFIAFIVPLAVLIISYLILLNGYTADWSDKVIVFLDWGFPIGQAAYFSVALLALLSSREILGGLMKKPIILLVIALVTQFLADFLFSYQASREVVTYYPGNSIDYLYFLAYIIMTFALVSIANTFYKVRES